MATIALETQLSRKSRGDSYARTECQGHEGALNLNMEESEGHQSIDTKFGQGEIANELDRGSEFRSKSEKGAFNPDTTPSDVMNPAHNVANGKSLNDGESILDAVLPTTTNNGDIIHGRSCRNSSSDVRSLSQVSWKS